MPTGVYIRTAETRRRMSKSKKGRVPWNKGIPRSKETCRKISKTLTGVPLSKEHRENIGKTSYLRNAGIGGEPTPAEKYLKKLNPSLIPEKVFGTGKGGMSKYGLRNCFVDFYDPTNKIVYEIDGSYHELEEIKERDARKTKFLNDIGIKVIRFTNEEVLKMTTSIK